ncbi:hypothetical protein SMICM304S_02948 [Streptomyces microflavus]
MNGANAAAIEMADVALLVTTPDVVAVRGAKRIVRMWERLQIRKAEETVTLVNRFTRNTEIQPPLIQKITGTRVANAAVPPTSRSSRRPSTPAACTNWTPRARSSRPCGAWPESWAS